MMCSSSTGTRGFNSVGAAGLSFKIADSTTPKLSPRNGSRPVAISYNTTPNENRSVRASTALARTCSGDMYDTVPGVDPGVVSSK